eukprot:scaffold16913_cov69-Phaeocystis_antarctica.AAC.2
MSGFAAESGNGGARWHDVIVSEAPRPRPRVAASQVSEDILFPNGLLLHGLKTLHSEVEWTGHEGKMFMSGKMLAACAGVGAARNFRTKSTESPGGMISKNRPSSSG